METIKEAQDQISNGLALIRTMGDVISAARHSSMSVVRTAATDLLTAAWAIRGAADAIERVRGDNASELRGGVTEEEEEDA